MLDNLWKTDNLGYTFSDIFSPYVWQRLLGDSIGFFTGDFSPKNLPICF